MPERLWMLHHHIGQRPQVLVGMLAIPEGLLRSSAAYDVAYQTIYEALPDCRSRCACQILLRAL